MTRVDLETGRTSDEGIPSTKISRLSLLVLSSISVGVFVRDLHCERSLLSVWEPVLLEGAVAAGAIVVVAIVVEDVKERWWKYRRKVVAGGNGKRG
jgi:hypothetical protein